MPKYYRLIIGIIAIAVTLLFLAIITVNITNIPGIGILYPTEPSEYVIGQTFSPEEASRIVNISSNNYYVREFLRTDSAHSNGGGSSVGSVTVARFLDITPDDLNNSLFWLPRHRVLPVVTYITGDPSYEGENVFAYVDPDREYVACLGFAARDGRKGNYSYKQVDGRFWTFRDGLLESVSSNLSIADTDLISPENMTEPYKERLIGIALNDSRVSRYLKGYDYEVGRIKIYGFTRGTWWGRFKQEYPALDFAILFQGKWGLLMAVTVDPIRDKVLEIRPYHFLTPAKNVTYYSYY